MTQSSDAIPMRLNLAIAAAVAAINLGALVALPLWLLPLSPAWGWALAAQVLTTPTLWALIHEAIHGGLHPAQAWNDRLGRALSGLFGAPFQALRLGHLMHHRFNRSPLNRVEVAPGRPSARARAAYFGRLCGGLFLGEMLLAPLAILPDRFWRPIIRLAFGEQAPDGRSMWASAKRQLLEEPGRSRLRLDGALITAGLGAAFILYGAHWWMLAAALAGRALLVSALDNVWHYANPLDDPLAGHDLSAPRPVQALLLNFNLHGTHHRSPSTPWTGLPAAQRAFGGGWAGGLGAAALRQFRGPIPEGALTEERPLRRAARR